MGCETDFVAKNDEFQQLGQNIVSRAFEEKPESLEALKSLKIGELTVQDKITEFVGKIGEKLDILAFETLASQLVVPYIHAGIKLGVLVALNNVGGSDLLSVGRDVAMQIAAMSPVSVDKDDVPKEIVDRELKIGREQAIAEGKPENIIDRIAEGKLNKYFKDNTLLNQPFVKDSSLTVGKYLQSVQEGLTVAAFRRVAIG
jgi:elongation factor Ts